MIILLIIFEKMSFSFRTFQRNCMQDVFLFQWRYLYIIYVLYISVFVIILQYICMEIRNSCITTIMCFVLNYRSHLQHHLSATIPLIYSFFIHLYHATHPGSRDSVHNEEFQKNDESLLAKVSKAAAILFFFVRRRR